MRAKVRLVRERGEFIPSYGPGTVATGDLFLAYRTTDQRRVPVLKLLGAERQWPNLYEPRIVDLSGTTIRFLGFETVGSAWVMQEWVCELL